MTDLTTKIGSLEVIPMSLMDYITYTRKWCQHLVTFNVQRQRRDTANKNSSFENEQGKDKM